MKRRSWLSARATAAWAASDAGESRIVPALNQKQVQTTPNSFFSAWLFCSSSLTSRRQCEAGAATRWKEVNRPDIDSDCCIQIQIRLLHKPRVCLFTCASMSKSIQPGNCRGGGGPNVCRICLD